MPLKPKSIVTQTRSWRGALCMPLALLLVACGDTTPEVDTGPDFSESPLQVKSVYTLEEPRLFGVIDFIWDEIDGATHYKLFADLDGDSDGDGEFEFVQSGPDIPSGTDPLQATVQISVHLLNWDKARFLLQSCTATECTDAGQQDVNFTSAGFIFALFGAGFSVAFAEDGQTLAVGSPSTSFFTCDISEVVPVETVEEECQYDETLTNEDGDPLTPEEALEELGLTKTISLAGTASIFTLTDGLWEQEAILLASNIEAEDNFGTSVAISDDGNRVAISAVGEDSNATGIDGDSSNNDEPNSGAVYIFERTTVGMEAEWNEVAYIKASNTEGDPDLDDDDNAADLFGNVVRMSGDGETLAVAAWGEDSNAFGIDGDQADNSAVNSGAVYVFRNVGGSWLQEAYVKASNTDADDAFGSSVAISADGNRLAVGAVRESSAASGIDGDGFNNGSEDSGAVYAFERSGSMWSQMAYIKASAPDSEDEFGFDVALSGAGDVLAVSAIQEDSGSRGTRGDPTDNSRVNSGAVYVFEESGGDWGETGFLKSSNANAVDEFGHRVAISRDGLKVVGSSIREGSRSSGINGTEDLEDFPSSGAAYLFVRRAPGRNWRQQSYIKSAQTTPGDLFGWDMAFAVNGERLAVTGFSSRNIFLY